MGSKKIEKILKKYKDTDERYYNDIFVGEEYKAAKSRKGVVIDLGACAGMFSFYIYDNASKIYAIEPYSKHFEELSNNVKDFPKIKPFRLAIAGSNGKRNLYIKERGGHSISHGSTNEETEQVEAVTLATFIRRNKIDFVDILKVDVEGAEVEIFSAPDINEAVDKVGFIVGELHGTDTKTLGILSSLGYKIKDILAGHIYEAEK